MQKVIKISVIMVMNFFLLNFFCYCQLSFDSLTLKEKNFINNHLVSVAQEQCLTDILQNVMLFIDKIRGQVYSKKSKKCIKSVLKKNGFSIIFLHFRDDVKNKKIFSDLPTSITLEHVLLPDYYLRIGIDSYFTQVTFAHIVISDFINALKQSEKLGFQKWGMLEKKLYHISGKPWDLFDANYVLVYPKREGVFYKKKQSLIRLESYLSWNNIKNMPEFRFLLQSLHLALDKNETARNCIIKENENQYYINMDFLLKGRNNCDKKFYLLATGEL